jgi:uncharacterized protein
MLATLGIVSGHVCAVEHANVCKGLKDMGVSVEGMKTFGACTSLLF